MRPLHGGAPEVRRKVRELMAAAAAAGDACQWVQERALRERAKGMAEAVRYFAPADGRRLAAEVEEVMLGDRDPATWRPIKGGQI
ncbi:MAG: hypothetical protein ACYCT1_08155 [Steroidobacteraceae bacterium]